VYLDLESQGYEVQSFIIPASAVNAPHQRYRAWIVAHTDHGNHNEKKEIRTRGNTINFSSADVADTDSKGLQRTEQHETYNGKTKTQFTTAKCFEERGYYWEFEPDVGRVANGIPRRVDRLKGLGNAIVPQIAYQIGKAIRDAEEI